MGIREMTKTLPKFLDKVFRFDATWMISGVQICRIFTGPVNEERRGWSRHIQYA
jgi:hypothetical protein